MNKRPATLKEAFAVVNKAYRNNMIRWVRSRNPERVTPVRFCDSIRQPVAAVPTKSPGMLIIGGRRFGTTEFVGGTLLRLLGSRGACMFNMIRMWELMLRVRLERRNGHDVWRVYLVKGRKNGKEEISMD